MKSVVSETGTESRSKTKAKSKLSLSNKSNNSEANKSIDDSQGGLLSFFQRLSSADQKNEIDQKETNKAASCEERKHVKKTKTVEKENNGESAAQVKADGRTRQRKKRDRDKKSTDTKQPESENLKFTAVEGSFSQSRQSSIKNEEGKESEPVTSTDTMSDVSYCFDCRLEAHL